ncbi:hypothetical protein FOZ63_026329, partial [Perkinsus olseni]
QWHQDWFVYHNVLKYLPSERLRGTFLDIGAADPFLLSNSVVFERCLGWQGVCIEPNPRAALLLDVYRENCTVVPVCLWSNDSEWSFEQGLELSTLHSPSEGKWTEFWVDEDTWRREGFMALRRAQTSAIGGVNLYDAKCFTLRSLSAMLGGIHADVISVDVEGAEVELFRGVGDLFSLTGALVAIIETRNATSFQIDQLLMPSGYVKLAMVGQDSIFVHLSVLQYLKNISYPNSLQSSSGRLWTYEAFQRRFADLDEDDKREGLMPRLGLVLLKCLLTAIAEPELTPAWCDNGEDVGLNVFMLWPWRKEEFTGLQYSAIDSVLFNYPLARVLLVANDLSQDMFAGHLSQGYCVSIAPTSLHTAVELIASTMGPSLDGSLLNQWVELVTRDPEKGFPLDEYSGILPPFLGHFLLVYHLAVYALQLRNGGLYVPMDGILLNTLEYVLPPSLAPRLATTTIWMELYVSPEGASDGAVLSREDFEKTVWQRSWMDRMEDLTVICATDCLRCIPEGSPSAVSWIISTITAVVRTAEAGVDVNALATIVAKTHIAEEDYVVLPCWLMTEPKFPDLWKNFGSSESLSARDNDLFSPRWTRERQDWYT